jgi:hypothetical protein
VQADCLYALPSVGLHVTEGRAIEYKRPRRMDGDTTTFALELHTHAASSTYSLAARAAQYAARLAR